MKARGSVWAPMSWPNPGLLCVEVDDPVANASTSRASLSSSSSRSSLSARLRRRSRSLEKSDSLIVDSRLVYRSSWRRLSMQDLRISWVVSRICWLWANSLSSGSSTSTPSFESKSSVAEMLKWFASSSVSPWIERGGGLSSKSASASSSASAGPKELRASLETEGADEV